MSKNNFSKFLVDSRLKAGFRSLDDVLNFAKKNKLKFPSKSSLSLYERGKVSSIKPEILQSLAQIYDLSYQDLAELWFKERYDIKNSFYKNNFPDFLLDADKNSISLKGTSEDKRDSMKIISLENFSKQQSNLKKGSQVGVAVSQFLDHEYLFEMVSENIAKGVNYFYLLPSTEYATYKTLITKVEEKYPNLSGKIDGKRTFFISRPPLDFPINYVVFIDHKKNLSGFVGLTHGTLVKYMRVADLNLAWRLYDGFCWTMSLSKDRGIKENIARLEIEFELDSHRAQSFYEYC